MEQIIFPSKKRCLEAKVSHSKSVNQRKKLKIWFSKTFKIRKKNCSEVDQEKAKKKLLIGYTIEQKLLSLKERMLIWQQNNPIALINHLKSQRSPLRKFNPFLNDTNEKMKSVIRKFLKNKNFNNLEKNLKLWKSSESDKTLARKWQNSKSKSFSIGCVKTLKKEDKQKRKWLKTKAIERKKNL